MAGCSQLLPGHREGAPTPHRSKSCMLWEKLPVAVSNFTHYFYICTGIVPSSTPTPAPSPWVLPSSSRLPLIFFSLPEIFFISFRWAYGWDFPLYNKSQFIKRVFGPPTPAVSASVPIIDVFMSATYERGCVYVCAACARRQSVRIKEPYRSAAALKSSRIDRWIASNIGDELSIQLPHSFFHLASVLLCFLFPSCHASIVLATKINC